MTGESGVYPQAVFRKILRTGICIYICSAKTLGVPRLRTSLSKRQLISDAFLRISPDKLDGIVRKWSSTEVSAELSIRLKNRAEVSTTYVYGWVLNQLGLYGLTRS